eukprot:801586_1
MTSTRLEDVENHMYNSRSRMSYHTSQRSIDYDQKEEDYLKRLTKTRFGVTAIGNQVSKYKSTILNAPFKICCCFPGSCCHFFRKERMLLVEGFFYIALFFSIVFVTATNKYNIIPNVVVESQSLGTLVAFLMGLYVALSLSRWWRLRTDGIGNIWSASSGMAMLLGPRYESYRDSHIDSNEDREILMRILIHFKRIQRYCQTSLALVFCGNGQNGFTHEDLVKREIMTQREAHQFQTTEETADHHGIPGSHPEYMWSLITRELEILKDEVPQFMSDGLELSLQTQVLKGRSGAGLIAAQLGAQLPLTYAHGVTLLGKLYNVVLCVAGAITFINLYVHDLQNANPKKYEGLQTHEIINESGYFFSFNVILSCVTVLIKTCANSMLLVLCEHLSNPFDNNIMAYPGLRYIKWIFMDFEILLGFSIKHQFEHLLDEHYDNKGGIEPGVKRNDYNKRIEPGVDRKRGRGASDIEALAYEYHMIDKDYKETEEAETQELESLLDRHTKEVQIVEKTILTVDVSYEWIRDTLQHVDIEGPEHHMANFVRHQVTDERLDDLSREDWKELIPLIGPRNAFKRLFAMKTKTEQQRIALMMKQVQDDDIDINESNDSNDDSLILNGTVYTRQKK